MAACGVLTSCLIPFQLNDDLYSLPLSSFLEEVDGVRLLPCVCSFDEYHFSLSESRIFRGQQLNVVFGQEQNPVLFVGGKSGLREYAEKINASIILILT